MRKSTLAEYQERFWSKVNKTSGVFRLVNGEMSECWVWTAGKSKGYGIFWVGRVVLAYAIAYEWANGPVPEGLELDHLCRTRECVRQDHLEPVTAGENLRRGETLNAKNLRKTHCPQGHPYDERNTLITQQGYRVCRACKIAKFMARPKDQRNAYLRQWRKQKRAHTSS